MIAILQTTFQINFLVQKNYFILIQISLKFVLKGPFKKMLAWVPIMAWHQQGDKPLSKPVMV